MQKNLDPAKRYSMQKLQKLDTYAIKSYIYLFIIGSATICFEGSFMYSLINEQQCFIRFKTTRSQPEWF